MRTSYLALFVVVPLILAGCGTVSIWRHKTKSMTPPPAVGCVNDSCHPDVQPFILGGPDFSPPTVVAIARWQQAGHFPGQSAVQIQNLYKTHGFEWYPDDNRCNCMCRETLHVIDGGKCLETPIPGTDLYERLHVGATR